MNTCKNYKSDKLANDKQGEIVDSQRHKRRDAKYIHNGPRFINT